MKAGFLHACQGADRWAFLYKCFSCIINCISGKYSVEWNAALHKQIGTGRREPRKATCVEVRSPQGTVMLV